MSKKDLFVMGKLNPIHKNLSASVKNWHLLKSLNLK